MGHYEAINIDDDQLPLLHDPTAWKVVNGYSFLNSWFRGGPCCEPQAVCSFEEETAEPVAQATDAPAATDDPAATNTTAPPTNTPTNTPVPKDGSIRVYVFEENYPYERKPGPEDDPYSGVEVRIAQCSCSDTICRIYGNLTTQKDGVVLFNNLPYGPYCVRTTVVENTPGTYSTPLGDYPYDVTVNSPTTVTRHFRYKMSR